MKSALLRAFKRKTPATKSPVKAPASEVTAAARASSPSRRLFSFTPSKAGGPAPSPLRPKSSAPRADEAEADGLIAAAPAAAAAPGGDAISVLVRIRPRSAREAAVDGAICVHAGAAGQVRLGAPAEPHAFSFDRVAGEGAGQAEVFALAGAAVVDNCLAGYNGCLMAYGQTGSGKTFTMLGGAADGGAAALGAGGALPDAAGLIPRAFERLFAAAGGSGGELAVRCSFLEIYNETVTDLLSPAAGSGGGGAFGPGGGGAPGAGLPLREDRRGGVFVDGLSEERVASVADVVALLARGTANRRVGETLMNDRSSRSHCGGLR